jgi:two-component sensor histidine kinase
VSDNGQGRTEDQIAMRSSNGLGTTIITGLTRQLKGIVTMQCEKGTCIEIRIPQAALS